MSFETGSTALRVFKLTKNMPADAIQLLANNALPPLEYLKDDPIYGWATGRHILDRDITEDTAEFGGILRVQLVKAHKKLPPKLLKAEIRAAEIARRQAICNSFLSRAERHEIAVATRAMLLPKMQPSFNAIQVIHVPHTDILLTDATSDTAADALAIHFRNTFGITIHPMTATTAGLMLAPKGTNIETLTPASFSHTIDNRLVSDQIGHDFLTWLWFMSEAAPEALETADDHRRIGVLIEGPLSFVMEGSGAHETTVRKGNPTISREARISMQAGKKLARCKLSLADAEQVWSFTFDPIAFTLRSLRPPACEEDLDPTSHFQYRITQISRAWAMLLDLYGMFLRIRTSPSDWPHTVEAMRVWIINRTEAA